MLKLEDNIINVGHYINLFNTWEAIELIIDDKKVFYMLKDPNSEYQKVCLFRDNYKMFIYGDYGELIFNNMTWKGDVFNLQYDNTGYQMEKLSRESRESLCEFDSNIAENDVWEWFKDRLESKYSYYFENDVFYKKLLDFLKVDLPDEWDIESYCDENNCEEIKDFLIFTVGLLNNCCYEEIEWIYHLRSVTSEWNNYEDYCDSLLWNAGKKINQRYYVNMLALKICGEKLKRLQ